MNGKSYKIYYDVNYTVLSVGVVNLRKRLVKGIGMDSANHVFVSLPLLHLSSKEVSCSNSTYV
jgi:hypothetical protein